ncbi:pilus assembly protein FimV [Pseudomonas nitritireducens]|uniref:Pilus assembly protein FimV n=1 Tax=Pseudomonas nitroreducens TaxID=46680 RepID=A0A7W7KS06_PSENT|nr:FimV family protein [Pseudomonas nitritireducens]MBB4867867.1 pilus assembly protein FimV [Pseudomonas nitritireducens]
MARINRIPLTLAALSVFISAHANALGLGDITLHSGLNQPLDAEIALLQTGDMSSDELIAKLASPADFENAGVDRFVFLQNLRFTPVIRNGRGYIKVVSTQPVHEPYLNFLLAVERPNGRLLREYTVLLDPPEYSANRSMAASVGMAEGAPARSSSYRSAPVRSAPAQPPLPAGDGRYTTVRNDTLWKITSNLSGSGASRSQLMDSIVALNPQAFVNGDPHRMKVGQTLILPQGQQYAGAGNAAPASQPAASAPAPEAPQSTGGSQAAVTAPSAPAPAGNAAGAPSTAAAGAAAGNGDLAKVEADLLLANAQRDQLNQRMDAMQKQLESLQQALESRDQQVQSLQAELGQRGGADAVAGTSSGNAAPAAPSGSAPAGNAPSVEAPTANAPTNAVPPAPNAVAPAAASQPAPVAAQPATPASDAQSDFNYWPWLGVGALGALLVGLLFARRKRDEKPVEKPPVVAAVVPEPVRPAPVAKPLAAAVVAPVPVPHPVVVATPEAGVARLPAASADSLEGADIYIAYGRFNQARDMLRKAVIAEPNRRELRMKLLLVLAELGDVIGFQEQERDLLAIGGEQKQIDQLKSRYPAMQVRAEDLASPPSGEILTDWDDLELGEVVEPAAAPQAKVAEEQPDFAMNLSDLSLDLDWDKLDNPFESAKPGKAPAKPEADVPADFRSNLHELPEITELDLGEHGDMFGQGSNAQGLDEDLSFDLPEDVGHEHDELLASLDRARQCIDQGNLEEAYGILKQVIASGDSKAKAEARELLALIA